ncbi:putative MscS family protein [Escovopsis weberi]|uniref:Mechanosensitive ion channel protein n=1 Tax=Escovopsis weberi TaxID=150374 RepID=A0A0M8MQ63_ESCWE|nr:putative MscS family protein [Escovopsis weberi]
MADQDYPVQHPQTSRSPAEQQTSPHHDLPLTQNHSHNTQPFIAEEEFEEDYGDEKRAGRPPSVACTSTFSHEGSVGRQMTCGNERVEAHRVEDELALQRAERQVSDDDGSENRPKSKMRVHDPVPEDAFNQGNSVSSPEKPRNKDGALYKLRQRVQRRLGKFYRFVRYFIYLLPGALLLFAPTFLGLVALRNNTTAPGPYGVQVMYFGIWLEVVWCSLWVSRMVAYLMPYLIKWLAKAVGSCHDEKWKEIGQRLEIHLALLLWAIAMLVSFKPLMYDYGQAALGHEHQKEKLRWVENTDKALIAILVLFASNFVEKILIQWITTTFHQRTYATRIQNNKADIAQLVKLFEYVKQRQTELGSAFWTKTPSHQASGTQTPIAALGHYVWDKVGQVAGKVGHDLIGRKVKANSAEKIVSELLRTERAARSMARQIYKCTVREGQETVHLEDLQAAFVTPEEAEAAFTMFDKDMNGDISLQEMEEVCYDIHQEKKSITGSLRDLDLVTGKLDRVFLAIIVLVAVVVFICIVSKAGAAGITSAGTSILGLAWMLQATAQEFLQSIIFVFIKHPFDVGDRVTIYGSTGASLTGDDYYVTEISLLYTEFRKLQGHMVQAPNSLLNTLFILNQRRSTHLTDSIPLQMRFGTPAEQIEELKARMLEFVKMHNRDYKPLIITEMTSFDQVRSCTMNMVFFHKSNFQNELLRLQRHNKFATELMHQMVLIGIESPLRADPGGSREYPMHWTSMPHQAQSRAKEPHQPAPSTMSSMLHRPRPRAYSIRSDQGTVDEELPFGAFQDVYEHRREQVNLRRMESIREKERGLRLEEEAIEANRPQPQGLQPMDSSASQTRSRIFGRSRSRTVGSAQNEVV